jgi:Domain of unknown function (DUF892)
MTFSNSPQTPVPCHHGARYCPDGSVTFNLWAPAQPRIELEAGPALDAVSIGIAAWGTAKALAQAVGQKTATRAMERALKEGGPFDERLTKLAAEEITPALLAAAQSKDDEAGTNGGKGSSRKRGSQGQAPAS